LKKGPNAFLLFFGLFISHALTAQEAPEFVQFFINPASLNASYVGIDGQPAVHLSFRKQWAGVPDGPTQGQISIQSPLPKKVLGGFTAFTNTRGLLSTSAFLFTGGYQVHVAEGHALRFGLSLGGSSTKVDVNGTTRPDDPQLLNLAANSFYMQGNAGISYHRKMFHVGLSLPQFFQPSYTAVDGAASIAPFQTVIIHASNRYYFSRNKNVFEPYAVYRIRGAEPSQFELAGVVHLQSKVWFGASYRQAIGPSVLAGLKINKQMILGYSFTSGVAKENQMTRPSHEAHVSFLLGKRDKNITGYYSFVNIDKEKKKKTAAELKAHHDELAKKYAEHNVHNEPHQPEKPVQKPVDKPADTAAVVQPKPDAPPPPKAERHEFVKKGDHESELHLSNYVIVGAFRSETNAKKFSQDLHQMDIEEAHYGYISARSLWYVYLAVSPDLEAVKAERDKYRHEHMFHDAWILTVHD
jgi:type IX secretion system PorP/SprF family membrane protein